MGRPERAVLGRAALSLALTAAGGALAAAGADALFLAHVGAAALGWAVAGSSLLVVAVLATVGAAADRADRGRLLAALSAASGAVAFALAGAAAAAPAAAATLALVAVKQSQSALDLLYWVVLAERLDARQSARLVPRLAAAGGIGAAAGALAAVPIAAVAGARWVLAAGGAVWLIAAFLPAAGERLGGRRLARSALPGAAWIDGARAVARHPLAAHLAVVVAAAGAFGSLAYYALGAGAAARLGSDAELAGFLGAMRGAVQIATLLVQLAVAPRILAGAGVGASLLVAPLGAVAGAVGVALAPGLVTAVAAQGQARLLDAAVETPAEKLAQNLLPVAVRGRIAGFLDGAAKRAGAVAGGLAAAALAAWPRALGAVMAIVGAAWLAASWRLRRRLPGLAIAALAAAPRRGEPLAAVDDNAIALLRRELAAGDAGHAAALLARLHQRGRTDAIAALTRAAAARDEDRDAVLAALVAAAPHRRAAVDGDAVAALAEVALAGGSELAIRALGLVGGDHPEAAAWSRCLAAAPASPVVSAAAAVAAARLAPRSGDDVDDAIAAALDDADPAVRACGVRDLTAATAAASGDRAFEHARRLVRAVRRGRGDDADRAAALDVLGAVLERTRGAPSAERVLLASDLAELARALADRRPDSDPPPGPPAVAAAALRLLAPLAEPPTADDVRLYAHALGDRDDDVRDAAEAALRRLGGAAAGELVVAAGYGRRAARDRALALLGELPVTADALDRLAAAELEALDRTCLHLGALAGLGDGLVARRLDERAREVGHTVLLLVAARSRSRALSAAASHLRHAPDAAGRARALAALDAALPRALVARLVDALDAPPDERAAAAAARLGAAVPAVDDAVRAELAFGDRLSRALVLHALGAAGRAAHRAAIAAAARDAASALSPLDLLRRITSGPRGEDDVPTRVETLLVLGKVPILAELTTRQLADVAEAARWHGAAAGETVVAAGDVVEALVVVADGELTAGARRLGRGAAVDELALVAPSPAPDAVVAAVPTRYVRIERVDFDELIDDVPGLGAAVCRALGARLRTPT